MSIGDHHLELARLARMSVWLRWVSVAAQLAVIAFASEQLRLDLPYAPLLFVVAAIAAFNALIHVRLARATDVGTRGVLAQLAFDAIALTALLYFSGGPTNPFVSLYLVPIALAAGTLQFGATVGFAVLCMACYACLLRWHVELPHAHGIDFDLHVTGMWINFLLGTAVLVAVLGRFTSQLRAHRTQVASLRERILRDETMLALGTLAAGAAHDLNTPLTTLGLLIDEAVDEPASADLRAMKLQVERCTRHVRTLAALARGECDPATEVSAAASVLARVVERLRVLRPEAEMQLADTSGGALVRSDATLEQALANVLDNAAKASHATGHARVDIVVRHVDAAVVIEVSDRGPGRERGSLPLPPGLGLGLLLSSVTLERFGGEIRQSARAGGGHVTTLRLPVASAIA